MTLPTDVTRCQPAVLCLRRMRCARWIGRPENQGERVPVTAFEPVGCEAFINSGGIDSRFIGAREGGRG